MLLRILNSSTKRRLQMRLASLFFPFQLLPISPQQSNYSQRISHLSSHLMSDDWLGDVKIVASTSSSLRICMNAGVCVVFLERIRERASEKREKMANICSMQKQFAADWSSSVKRKRSCSCADIIHWWSDWEKEEGEEEEKSTDDDDVTFFCIRLPVPVCLALSLVLWREWV